MHVIGRTFQKGSRPVISPTTVIRTGLSAPDDLLIGRLRYDASAATSVPFTSVFDAPGKTRFKTSL